jgi:uncharacterized radical SAM superfamily Fe-S cluster-containing enzyme
MPLREDRILRYVTAFCPRCHDEAPERALAEVRRLSGALVARDDRVWLERGCPTHGLVSTLYDEDPEILAYLEEWTAPTKVHTPDVAGNYDPIPMAYLRGLPEMQTQHTCILLEDIAETCNLRCPTCFTDSSPDLRDVVPVADILANVDQRLARENGRLDVLMLSGGEPTLHPHLPVLLAELTARPITRILINSNGLRIAADDGLLDLLTEHRERVEVYLQYDGLSETAHRFHRGGDLRRTKVRALQRLSEHHPRHDHRAGRQRRRDRRHGATRPRYPLCRRYHHPAPIRFGPIGFDRSNRPAHPHRGAQTPRSADRWLGHLARSHRAAVFASALLFGRLSDPGRQ